MSKAVLISIRPEWCEKIVSGQKMIEVRKNRPKIETPFKCYIYETQGKCSIPRFVDEEGHMDFRGRGQVIGEFICDRIDTYESEFWDDDSVFNAVWRVEPDEDDEDSSYSYMVLSNENEVETLFESAMGMSLHDLKAYIGIDKPNKTFYGWYISDLVIYDKPRELREFYKPGFSSIEDLDEDLCKYCYETDYGEKKCYSTPYGPVMCEGDYCTSAYEAYLDEEGFTITRPPQSWCYVEEL